MVTDQDICSFINYKYTPFDKAQCVKRLLFMWIIGIIMCFIGKRFALWIIPISTVNMLLSAVFIVLIARCSQSPVSRYLCDGIFCLYVAVVLNLASYKVMTLQIGSNLTLAFILMSLLIGCVLIFVLITFLNIKLKKFSEEKVPKAIVSLPIVSGVVGILTAKILLHGQSQQSALMLMAYILLLLSFIMGIPSVNLLKALLYRRKRRINQNKTGKTGDG